VPIGSTPFTQTGYASSYQYQIGTGFTLAGTLAGWPAGNGGYFYFQGLIDEVEFFNRALTLAEVQAILNAGSNGKCRNHPPVAVCKNVTVSACVSAMVSIYGGSSDSDHEDDITLSQSPPGPYPIGTTIVTLTVTDNHGASSQCKGTVTVTSKASVENTSLKATPNVLWPPDGKMVPVKVTASASSCAAATCKIVSVSSSEPAAGDWVITGNLTVNLRAQRSGSSKSGRVYTITVQCTDAAGNTTTKTVTVTVPHDQGQSGDSGDDHEKDHGGDQ
jgi:hypothetical protein